MVAGAVLGAGEVAGAAVQATLRFRQDGKSAARADLMKLWTGCSTGSKSRKLPFAFLTGAVDRPSVSGRGGRLVLECGMVGKLGDFFRVGVKFRFLC